KIIPGKLVFADPELLNKMLKIACAISVYIKCRTKNKQWQYVPCQPVIKKGRGSGPLFRSED
ncbi:hypothetical protein, partial [Klebsiella pneumoniae]|uniref:hypothetical protein n=1 Tax=Klebsiella pneumoniae TaxID=573 RepID=UPI000D64EFA6